MVRFQVQTNMGLFELQFPLNLLNHQTICLVRASPEINRRRSAEIQEAYQLQLLAAISRTKELLPASLQLGRADNTEVF